MTDIRIVFTARRPALAARLAVMVNSVGMFRRLATLDLGVILLPEEVVADDLAAGRLRRVLPEWQGNRTPVYALTETRLLPAKTRRIIEFVQERLGQHAGARQM